MPKIVHNERRTRPARLGQLAAQSAPSGGPRVTYPPGSLGGGPPLGAFIDYEDKTHGS